MLKSIMCLNKVDHKKTGKIQLISLSSVSWLQEDKEDKDKDAVQTAKNRVQVRAVFIRMLG